MIEATDDAASPFFSPEGDWIGFLADESLKKVSLEGGVPVAVLHATGPSVSRGFTWSTGDTVIQSLSANSGLSLSSVAGDAMRPFDELEEITEHGFVLTPGRYVGAEAQEDDGVPFEEKFKALKTTLERQFADGGQLAGAIRETLARLEST